MPPTTADFRNALRLRLQGAGLKGQKLVEIRAGNLHGAFPGPQNRMPSCCNAMRSEMVAGDAIVRQPPSGNGANLVIRYQLPRSGSTAADGPVPLPVDARSTDSVAVARGSTGRRTSAPDGIPAFVPPKADDFRQALRSRLQLAANQRLTAVDIRSGDVHADFAGPRNRMPSCCNVMRSEMSDGDTVIRQPPSGNGANLVIRYKLPRAVSHAKGVRKHSLATPETISDSVTTTRSQGAPPVRDLRIPRNPARVSNPTVANHETVGQALLLLRAGLGPYIEKQVRRAVVAGRINAAELHPYVPNLRTAERTMREWDVALLLKLMWETWNDIFRRSLGPAERGLVGELRGHRNAWAHQEPFSDDDAYRALDTASRLLAAVGASETREVEVLKTEVLGRLK